MSAESAVYLPGLRHASRDATGEPSPAETVVRVPIRALTPTESPRLAGENTEYTRMLADSEIEFPPIIVHRPTMRIIDGLHRFRATLRRGQDHIAVRFFDGGMDDAFVIAVRNNVGHGLPLSLADRRAAATRIIRSHSFWSNRAIALITGLSHKTVGSLRAGLSGEIPQLDTRVGRDGRCRPVDSTAGRRAAGQLLREVPDASLRDIAETAGIAVETARDVRKRLSANDDPVPARQRPPRTTGGPDRVTALPRPRPRPADTGGTDRPAPVIEQLRRDPSLRLSENGRVLLRLFGVLAVGEDGLERLAQHVPRHCADSVAEAASQCADIWQSFAEQLRQREQR